MDEKEGREDRGRLGKHQLDFKVALIKKT